MNKPQRKDSQDFQNIFINDIPLMDVRAPVEFSHGAFPGAVNCPLLDDQQREKIGIRYKNAGQEEAIQYGLELATDEIRALRLQQWTDFCENNPNGYLYCFRGGLRSKTTQQWLEQSGIHYPLVPGGYKAMRGFLLEQLNENLINIPLVLLTGPTGSGKTKVLNKLSHTIDFEGLAKHRGSAFGHTLSQQPSQIDWENRLAIELMKQKETLEKGGFVVVEDESRLIGKISLPNVLQMAMKKSKLIILHREMVERVTLIRKDYIELQWPQYQNQFGDQALEKFTEFVLGNLSRIRKRLGGLRYQQIEKLFQAALKSLDNNNDASGFNDGILRLLEEYYDPMYSYQLKRRQGTVLFSGNESELIAWFKDQQGQKK